VNTGAIDPLDALADIARREGLWFHVDGAYGGMFVATSRASRSLKAMALADSLVLDPHKGLFMPYGIGAVLVRDPARLKRGFSYQADYLVDALNDAERSPADYSPELTRHFRALRLWICLQVHGFAPFRAALEEKLLLAELAQERLRELPGVEVGPEPQLSAVLFRLEAGDDATREWLDRVWARRRVYFNTTRLDGKLYLRFCILCFRTHLDEVELALREVVETLPDSRKHS
jgi:glutamate/tyrosine decarboxylase-like PLP-dependent enzyme